MSIRDFLAGARPPRRPAFRLPMTAPARVAAYHALCGHRRPRAGPSDGARRGPAAAERPARPGAGRRDRARHAALAARARRVDRDGPPRTGRLPADGRVLTILRLSLYQILHLDRVPASAVVDDAVDLRAPGAARAGRRLRQRAAAVAAAPAPPAGLAAAPAAGAATVRRRSPTSASRTRIPTGSLGRWLDRYGFDAAEAWVRFNNATPAVTLRVNALRATRAETQAWLDERGGHDDADPPRAAGLVVEETENAGLLHEADGPLGDPGRSVAAGVADGRRAPGRPRAGPVRGARRQDHGDGGGHARHGPARGLRRAAAAHPAAARHVDRVRHARDARVVHVGSRRAAAVCGRLRPGAGGRAVLGPGHRAPRPRHQVAAARGRICAGLAAASEALLDRAAAAVAPGGRLVYATCSSEPEENDDVVDALPRTHIRSSR